MKYQIPFKSLKNKDCLIEIYDNPESLEVVQLTGGSSPFSMEETDEADLTRRLRYLTGYIQVVENSWNELQSIDNSFMVDMTYDGVLYFHGYVNYNNISESLSSFPRIKKIPVISALGRLKDTPYPIDYIGTGVSRLSVTDILHRLMAMGGWLSWLSTGNFAGYINTEFVEYLNENFSINVNEFTGSVWQTKTFGEILEAYCTLYDLVLHDTANMLIFSKFSYEGEYTMESPTSHGAYHANVYGNTERSFSNDYLISSGRFKYEISDKAHYVIERYDPQYGGASIEKRLVKVPEGGEPTKYLDEYRLYLMPVTGVRGAIGMPMYGTQGNYHPLVIYAKDNLSDIKFVIQKNAAQDYPYYSLYGYKPLASFDILAGVIAHNETRVYFEVELSEDDKNAIKGGTARQLNYTVQMNGQYFNASGQLQTSPVYHTCSFDEEGIGRGIYISNSNARLAGDITVTIYNNKIEEWSQHVMLNDISIKAYEYQDDELVQATLTNKVHINNLYGDGNTIEIDNSLNMAVNGQNRLYIPNSTVDNPDNDYYYLGKNRRIVRMTVRPNIPLHEWFSPSQGLLAIDIALCNIYAGLYNFYDGRKYRTFALSFYPHDDEFSINLQEYYKRPT
jgi:hypothetical protein